MRYDTYCFPNQPNTRYSGICDKLRRRVLVNRIHDQCKNHSIAYSVQTDSISSRRSSISVSIYRLWSHPNDGRLVLCPPNLVSHNDWPLFLSVGVPNNFHFCFVIRYNQIMYPIVQSETPIRLYTMSICSLLNHPANANFIHINNSPLCTIIQQYATFGI